MARLWGLGVAECGDSLVIAGTGSNDTRHAVELTERATEIGVDAVLVVAPYYNKPNARGIRAHYRAVAEATDLPIILFQYPMAGGLGYPLDTLLRLVEEVPQILAIKDWCNDPMLHERHVRTLQGLSRPVTVLSTHSSWLMSSLVMGCEGLLSGAGSVIADLQVALFQAVQAKDLARAQAINDRIYPMVQAFYAPPFLDMHNRMKEALVLLGRMERAVVRPPLMKLGPHEILRLKQAIAEARLGAEGALDLAA
jgi:4-hydroxy-tetrahydrodipicolinate synthase